ncbi:MAG: UPF0182 family protein [Candidatus Nomurabacteria bacterium]|nr:MAG: UPF0182 family protein [Candidatus Nomurabacteria bacterium]
MRRWILTIVAVVFVLSALIAALANTITDWWWFQSIQQTDLFLTPLYTQLLLGFGVGLFVALLFFFNTYLVGRFARTPSKTFQWSQRKGDAVEIKSVAVAPFARKISMVFALLLGLIFGFTAASHWETVQLFLHRVAVGQTDPLFGRDVSYYFFTLPFVKIVVQTAFAAMLLLTITTIVLYFVHGALEVGRRIMGRDRLGMKTLVSAARQHLSIISAILFALVAVQLYFIAVPDLVYSATGPITGASYTDVHIRLPILYIGTGIAILLAVSLLAHSIKSSTRWVAGFAGAFLVLFIVGGWLVPDLLQRFVVLPNELDKESEYITRHLEATRQAYGLDTIEKRDLSGDTALTRSDIDANPGTIKNVRLWDRDPLLDTFSQIQEIRTYYEFNSIDNDRYTINGDYRQVLLSPRELEAGNLPQRNFINEHLTFTHGYGLTLGPVNEVTPEGLPVLFVQDIPPSSSTNVEVKRPEIYFGELANDYVVVDSGAKEFDYPSGEENVFSDYSGDGGVQVNSLFRKLLYAIRFQSSKFLFSSDIKGDSRVMYYRDIQDRVQRTLPFLRFDGDPYLVVRDDGSLTWIYDAYTTSNAYPYAERVSDALLQHNSGGLYGQINYIRNAVKVSIDGYTGAMTFYVADANDAIIQAYQGVFPASFTSMNEMPDDLRSHIRFPEDMFQYLTNIYSIYHMEDAQIFYNREDQWSIPTRPNESSDPFMRHMIMRLPEEEKEEYILMLPFTPRGKDNLSAWMVARNDGQHYGQLVVYRFPKQKLVYGPIQIINRINQDPDISRQISLWDQRGSEVIRGNLLVIPIESSLLYVQPIYLRAEGGRIPELKRVIVAHENKIAMEETLDQALIRLFPRDGEAPAPSNTTDEETDTTDASVAQQASDAYQRALDAQRNGDWTTYGEEIQRLGELLGQLNQ